MSSKRGSPRDVAVIVGSLRRGSFNRRVAQAVKEIAKPGLALDLIEIGQLPLYNQDSDDDPPGIYEAFRKRIRAADALLFVTPEYNRSVPGVLKNAIDVGSRPYGQNVWNAKPGAVISVSVGAIGGFGANHHLRQTLAYLNVPALPNPELYIGNAASLFDGEGRLTNDKTLELLHKFVDAFAAWIDKLAPVAA